MMHLYGMVRAYINNQLGPYSSWHIIITKFLLKQFMARHAYNDLTIIMAILNRLPQYGIIISTIPNKQAYQHSIEHSMESFYLQVTHVHSTGRNHAYTFW